MCEKSNGREYAMPPALENLAGLLAWPAFLAVLVLIVRWDERVRRAEGWRRGFEITRSEKK